MNKVTRSQHPGPLIFTRLGQPAKRPRRLITLSRRMRSCKKSAYVRAALIYIRLVHMKARADRVRSQQAKDITILSLACVCVCATLFATFLRQCLHCLMSVCVCSRSQATCDTLVWRNFWGCVHFPVGFKVATGEFAWCGESYNFSLCSCFDWLTTGKQKFGVCAAAADDGICSLRVAKLELAFYGQFSMDRTS